MQLTVSPQSTNIDTCVPCHVSPGATPAFKLPSSSSAAPSSAGPIESTFEVIKGVINEDVVKSTQGIYQFDLSGTTRHYLGPD